jgi:L-ascorbate metabolism protein UlaG (beta-lactamase superfamily)
MRKITAPILALCLATIVGFSLSAESISISYLGHSCFTVQSEEGPIIMIDPYASYVPYPALPQPADIVLMTHSHIDHCPACNRESDRILGNPIEVKPWDNMGRVQDQDLQVTDDLLVRVTGASHVTALGGGSGYVGLLSFEIGGLRFAHLGDLGKVLTEEQINALQDVDVLFLPVGGAFTIDATEALDVISQLPSVKIVFPMHYNVEGITPWPTIAPLLDFTALAEPVYTMVEQETHQILIDSENLPESVEIWILDFME